MHNLLRRSLPAVTVGAVIVGSLALAGTAFAAQTTQGHPPYGGSGWTGHSGSMNMKPPAVVGTVASVSGDTLTVTSKAFMGRGYATSTPTSSTTYTVDASGATVTKDNATSTVSAIAVGDMVFVQGTVSGTDVTATSVMDGMPMMRGGKGPGGMGSSTPMMNPAFTGNGEPIVGGNVSAISGSTLTLTTTGGATYTVDASSANVLKMGTTTALTNVAIGDNVLVQGTVDGSAVTASTVVDEGVAASGQGAKAGMMGHGIIGAIGGFFTKLFGFF